MSFENELICFKLWYFLTYVKLKLKVLTDTKLQCLVFTPVSIVYNS